MITQDVTHAVLPIVENLLQQNLQVLAKPSSPIGLLASNLVFQNHQDNATIADQVGPLSSLLTDASESTELMFETMADEIAKKLSAHLSFARNTVAPLVGEFAQAIIPTLDAAAHNELNQLEIVQRVYPPLALNAALKIDRFEVDMNADVGRMFHEKSRSDSEVLELMLVGKANVDADIHEFAAALPAGVLSHIWDSFFTTFRTADSVGSVSTGQLFLDGQHGLTRALAVFMVASKLSEKAESDCNSSADLYTEKALKLRNQAGTHIGRFNRGHELELEQGALILGEVYPKIFVNQTIYQKFIQGGGSNDAILGRWLMRDTAASVAAIKEKAPRFEEAWRMHTMRLVQDADNKRHVAAVRVLRNSFPEFLAQQSEELAPIHTRHQAVARFESRLRTKTVAETGKIYAVCLDLLCYALFDHTDAFTILSGVGRAFDLNPTATPAECVSLSLTEYLGAWGATCLTVTKADNRF